jgi:iron complex outermembrane receptor protein
MPIVLVIRAAAAAVAIVGAAAYASEAELETVIVTAEKRSEPLQDVPAAVSALTAASLEAMGAESFTDYARSIPGLTFQDLGGGRQTPTLRGINPNTGVAAVGYYIGETPMPSASSAIGGFAANPRLIDIDRIEVLRGPQGTLYGSSSIGGTIKLIPHAPNLSRFEGSVKAEALVTQGENGASPGGQAELVLNLPIADGVAAVRGAFWGADVGGFINRTWTNAGEFGTATGSPVGKVGNLPDEHTWGFRTTALLQPTEQFSLSAMAYLQRQHFDGFTDITGGLSNPNNQLVQNLISDTPEPQDQQFDLYSITAKYSFGRFNVISSTSYTDNEVRVTEEGGSAVQLFSFFVEPSPPPVTAAFPTVADVPGSLYNFTQEARLATSESIAGFDALVGVFYSKAHSTGRFDWSPPEYNALVAGNDPTNPLYAPNNNLYASRNQSHERQTAEFGELTYHFTDSLSLTGGLRHYDVSNDSENLESGWFVGGNTPGVTAQSSRSSSANGFVYKGDLSYHLTPDHLLYAQYSEGFRPGFGTRPLPPSLNCGPSAGASEVQPDSIKSYELGAKTGWFERHLTVNAAAYRINWKDIQQAQLLQCGYTIAANFGAAVVKGAEFEVNDQLTRRVSAGLSATYLRAELQQDEPPLGAFSGDQIEQVPKWQYALYAQTTFPLLEADDGFARLDYQYTGSSFGNYSRLADGSRDPASEVQVVRLLNLRTGVHYHAWEFALAGTNLLNNTVRQSLDPWATVTVPIAGRPRYVITRPRAFSLSVKYQF